MATLILNMSLFIIFTLQLPNGLERLINFQTISTYIIEEPSEANNNSNYNQIIPFSLVGKTTVPPLKTQSVSRISMDQSRSSWIFYEGSMKDMNKHCHQHEYSIVYVIRYVYKSIHEYCIPTLEFRYHLSYLPVYIFNLILPFILRSIKISFIPIFKSRE